MTKHLQSAFTMAEILLSLTIIGVVAAITLPSLTGNINERTWNTQRKALYARFSQAIALMPALNGYGTLDNTTDNAAETFITAGLSKVLKINNICSENFQDCGIPENINPYSAMSAINLSDIDTLGKLNDKFTIGSFSNIGSIPQPYNYSQTDTKAAAFETGNGESILVYYSPTCVSSLGENSRTATSTGMTYYQSKVCANFIYDLNGTKGPNTVGKDIGVITVLYPVDSVVLAPYPINQISTSTYFYDAAVSYCKNVDSESRLPNVEEAASIFVNKKLFGYQDSNAGNNIATSTVVYETGALKARTFNLFSGDSSAFVKGSVRSRVWCIKR